MRPLSTGKRLGVSWNRLLAWTVLVMLAAVCSACVLPKIELPDVKVPAVQPTSPAPTSAPTDTQQQIQVQAKLAPTQPISALVQADVPPALVEVQPVSGSVIDLQSSLTFYFTQPMSPDSVKSAFQIQPAVEGKLDWTDAATLRFTPVKPLPASTTIRIVISKSAISTSNKNLVQDSELVFQTVDPLKLQAQIPPTNAQDVSPSAAIVASFNRPVVALVGEATQQPQGFTVTPDIKGHGEWVNTSTYIFYPQPALAGGTTFTVKLNGDLGIGTGQDWSFKTVSPELTRITPDDKVQAYLDAPIVLKFNQPMDPVSVESNFRLADASGGQVRGSFTWNKDNSQATFQPDMQLTRSTSYTVTLSGQAQSQGGTSLGSDITSNFNTVSNPDLVSFTPGPDQPLQVFEGGYAAVTLKFNVPLSKRQKFDTLVQVDPPVSGVNTFLSDDSNLIISAYFLSSTRYTISLSGAVQDRWGQTLGAEKKITFSTSKSPAAFVIPMLQAGNGILFLTPGETALKVRDTNVLAINTGSSNLSVADFVRQANDVQKDNFEPKSSWRQEFTLPDNQSGQVDANLTSTGAPLTPGLYYFQITSPDLSGPNTAAPQPFLVVSSDVQMVLKRSATSLFIWAVDLQGYEPVKATKISVVNSQGQEIGASDTDQQGIAHIQLPVGNDPSERLYAVMGKPGDANFSLATTAWSQGVEGWDFGLPIWIKDNQPMVYLYTDRPIYQPGQKVYFKAVARKENNGRYSLLDLGQLNVSVSSGTPGEAPLTSQALPLSPYGTATGEFTLPNDTPPGIYTFSVAESKDTFVSFQVANYRKPQIDLSVGYDKQEGIFGENHSAQVKAMYYFGAPAGGLSVSWNLYASPANFDMPEDFQTGKLDTSWLMPPGLSSSGGLGTLVAQGQGETQPDGTLSISLPADVLNQQLDPEKEQKLTVEVTAQDESRQPVSARTSMTQHPATFYIGVRPDAWSGAAQAESGFNIQTVDLYKNPSGGHPLTARFEKVVWTEEDPPGVPIGVPNYRMDTTEVSSTDFTTDSNGRARIAFTPSEPGTYMVDVRGGGAVTQVLLWVGGQGSAPWPALPNQHLEVTADAAKYKPGQTANIFIPNPYKQGGLALVTLERAQVTRPIVLPVVGSSLTVPLQLSEAEAPNVYVSVTLLGRQENGKPDFRQGYVELQVEPVQEILQVQLTPTSPQLSPGTQAGFTIEVKDARGQPVQGEFSLALIDKAVLALADPNTPDINEAFYGRQPLGVASSLSLAAYGERIPLTVPGRGGGGGGFPESSVRQNFLDTAYWNGQIETDSSGKAVVNAPLPDNLTTWVADLRGITKDSRSGEAQSQVVTSKELLVRPVTPRFFVAGDHVELAAIVQNNTGRALSVDARLQATGFHLDDPARATQTVNVPANGRIRVTWWGTAEDTDVADLVFSAQSGGLEDSSRPEAGKLPVLHYSVPEAFGTTGLLDKAGEKTELVSLPRSFTPTGGELQVEMSPSLAASILSGLQVLDGTPDDLPEAAISKLLPNLAAYRALKDLGANSPGLQQQLNDAVRKGLQQVVRTQNENGGWGWVAGGKSDPYISAYILFGLTQAANGGLVVPQEAITRAQSYVSGETQAPSGNAPVGQLDQMVFQAFVLKDSGVQLDVNPWYQRRDQIQPWSKALLALMLQTPQGSNDQASQLMNEVQSSRFESATGVHWEEKVEPGALPRSSATFTSAVVTYALARQDPAAPALVEAVRWLVLNRQPQGGWSSTYDSAWSLLALTQALKGTGDLQASYRFSAQLNDKPLANGQVGGADTLNPVLARVPLADLSKQPINTLTIQRDEGAGRLYYRAYLQVNRPVETAPAVNRGVGIERTISQGMNACGGQTCPAITSVTLGNSNAVLTVRLTLNLAQAASHLIVEDNIPAGAEILDQTLNTAQQGVDTPQPTLFDPANPYAQGWGWWLFSNPQVYNNRIRWTAENLPAGTYQLTYRLVVQQAGEFRLIPAQAYEYYFPEVQGSSAGSIFTVKP